MLLRTFLTNGNSMVCKTCSCGWIWVGLTIEVITPTMSCSQLFVTYASFSLVLGLIPELHTICQLHHCSPWSLLCKMLFTNDMIIQIYKHVLGTGENYRPVFSFCALMPPYCMSGLGLFQLVCTRCNSQKKASESNHRFRWHCSLFIVDQLGHWRLV